MGNCSIKRYLCALSHWGWILHYRLGSLLVQPPSLTVPGTLSDPVHSQDNNTLPSTAPSQAGKSSSTARHLPCLMVGWDCSSPLPPQGPKTKLSPTKSELPQRKRVAKKQAAWIVIHTYLSAAVFFLRSRQVLQSTHPCSQGRGTCMKSRNSLTYQALPSTCSPLALLPRKAALLLPGQALCNFCLNCFHSLKQYEPANKSSFTEGKKWERERIQMLWGKTGAWPLRGQNWIPFLINTYVCPRRD